MYRSILAADKLNAQASVSLAQLDVRQGKVDDALELLGNVFSSKPDSLPVGLYYSGLLLADKQSLKALDVSRTLLTAYPDNVKVLLSLGRAQLATGDLPNAQSTFEKINHKYPDSADSVLMYAEVLERGGDRDTAGKLLSRYLVKHKGNIPVSMNLALLDIRRGHYDAALKIAKNLQVSTDTQAVGLRLEADVLRDQKKWTQALDAYERAYAKQATSYLALRIYYLKQKLGDASALDTLGTWVRTHPDDMSSRLVLAQAYMQADRIPDAEREYKAVLKLNPANPLVLNNLAWLYFQQSDKRALKYAQRAYALAPTRYEVTDTLGWIMLHQGDKNKALELIRSALNRAPHVPQIRYHLAVALHRNGDDVEAKKTLQRLLRSVPRFADRPAALTLLKSL